LSSEGYVPLHLHLYAPVKLPICCAILQIPDLTPKEPAIAGVPSGIYGKH